MSICPEGEYRNSLSEEEFWNYVYSIDPNYNTEDFEEPEQTSDCTLTPCNVCGNLTACGYDSEGCPMIHVVEDSKSEDEN